jgi:hypothetical protein
MAEQKYGMFPVNVARRIFINAGGGGDREVREFVQRGGGPGQLLARSPSGGIAARSGTTISSAVCTVWERSGSTISATSRTITVYNLSTSAVGGTAYIIAGPTNIGYVAVWEDC